MGSFVSPKAVPQLADTEEVLKGLTVPDGADLLCIIANERGLERALNAPNVTSVGYPLSVNETFQQRNTNRSLEDSWPLVETIAKGAAAGDLQFVIYLSMGFGNPYGEHWEPSHTAEAVERLRNLEVEHIALADTVGNATPELIKMVLAAVPQTENLGLHLHARPDSWQGQLETALNFGLSWFEGALAGIGGCPFATDELVGNLPSEQVLRWLEARTKTSIVPDEVLKRLSQDAAQLATQYH